jgi:hypothetical protein
MLMANLFFGPAEPMGNRSERPAPQPEIRHGQPIGASSAFPRMPVSRVGRPGWEDGDAPLQRRKLLAGLAATAAVAGVSPLVGSGTAQADEALLGELLVARLRDAMLGLGPTPSVPPRETLAQDLTRALADFDGCRYAALAVRLPRLIRAGHANTTAAADISQYTLLAKSYLLATRMLVKLDEQQLGWMAADRARQLAEAADDVLAVAESARQLAVLARKAGWHSEALSIALSAADRPDLRSAGRAGTALRGLLVQSASYTLARRGDRDGMRELTDEAAAIAKELGGATLLRDHGGFSPLTVALHRISAENHAGDPMAALSAARSIPLEALPSLERRSRALGDIAVTYDRLGRRSDCIRTLLRAEQCAPQETHARPATKTLISSLLVSGPTSTELRGLAERSGVLARASAVNARKRRTPGPLKPVSCMEVPLEGGRITQGVVRVGETVRRPATPSSAFVAELLGHLQQTGFVGAPRYLGVDEAGRESFSYLPGLVPARFQHWSDAQVAAAGKLLRSFHDATAGSSLAGECPVVCHHDPGPNNAVFQHGLPTAFIDFDTAAPGERLEDLGYMAWTWCVSTRSGAVPAQVQAAQVRLLADAYGLPEAVRQGLVDAILDRQTRNARWWRTQLTSPGPRIASGEQIVARIAWSEREHAYVTTHRPVFEGALLNARR